MIDRLRLPERGDRLVVGGGGLVWTGALIGGAGGSAIMVAIAVGGAIAVVRRSRIDHRWLVIGACLFAVGFVSGHVAERWSTSTMNAGGPSGPVRVLVDLETDPVAGRFGSWAVAVPLDPTTGARTWPPVLLIGDVPAGLAVGDVAEVRGSADPGGGAAGGVAYGWRLRVRTVDVLGGTDWLLGVANAARAGVDQALRSYNDRAGAALVKGFLIGDERELSEVDRAAMRAVGLSHFTAVSGSNVALFLGALWVLAGPLGMGGRRRAIGGLVALVLFAAITRWEPSVLRACVMAGLVLTARAVGLALTPWAALGAATGILVAWSGALATSVGFQLSVAAAAGVIAGAGYWRRPVIGPAVSTAVSAHMAVAPILLLRFGEIPTWGPVVNLVAAPIVGLATIMGAAGVLVPLRAPMAGAVMLADIVLAVARVGAGLPGVGPWSAAVPLLFVVASRVRTLRVPAIVVAIVLAATLVRPTHVLPNSAVVFFDVGQGDAAAIRTPNGGTILVDGGPDAVVLDQKLAQRGIERVDLLIVSHSHRDHIDGLAAVIGRRPVGRIWHSDPPDDGGSLRALIQRAERAGVVVEVPDAGTVVDFGGLLIEVVGPVRRYASPNDQSLVVRIRFARGDVLFTGDIERFAQADLPAPVATVLKVPHQGAATSDPDWLAAIGASLAVVSVGPNTYGHPSREVIDSLEQAGARVRRTDALGDILVSFAD
ncbi:MAG: ComEC/Rec2 family competence protein [Acidimicrobiia bacterium]|nr:ComEC/Rec2 family competence protein [Acidimicrobiia bacterium]